MVVSISKMSIAYYLSTVSKGDVPQATSKPLTAYYTETATPPGRWWGSGLAGLSGLASGQQVDRRDRSEEHTSELQSRGHLVCRLLLEIKNDIVYILTCRLNIRLIISCFFHLRYFHHMYLT